VTSPSRENVKQHVRADALNQVPIEAESRVESLSWTVRLSEDAPHKRWVVLAFALIAGVSGALLMGNLVFGLVGFAMIMASTAEVWLGVRYSLTPTGANRRCGISVSAIDWADVKRVVVEGSDVKLSTLDEDSRMDAFRGITLRTTSGNREPVIAFVRRQVGEDVRILG
jgi:hypothetical protein